MDQDTTGLLKIGELAKASGTSLSTVKYYVKEGLVEIAMKTGRNMAYYRPESVRRVLLIKSLQKEKYYPLSVIKHLLENGEPSMPEIELYDAIHKVDRTAAPRRLTLAAAMKETGLSRAQIEALEAAGLIASVQMENKRVYRQTDCRIMHLVKRRAQAGLPFAQTLKAFAAYEQALSSAVLADVDAVISDAIVPAGPSTGEIVRMIRVSDETLDDFVTLRRYELNRLFGSRHIDDIGRFSYQLKSYLSVVSGSLGFPGAVQLCSLCAAALSNAGCPDTGTASDALKEYVSVIGLTGQGLAESIAVCSKANHFFDSLRPGTAMRAENLLLHALRVGWFFLAPDVLLCNKKIDNAADAFEEFAKAYGEEGLKFRNCVLEALKGGIA
jgi:DNA-binding transcriptional MerR regulator